MKRWCARSSAHLLDGRLDGEEALATEELHERQREMARLAAGGGGGAARERRTGGRRVRRNGRHGAHFGQPRSGNGSRVGRRSHGGRSAGRVGGVGELASGLLLLLYEEHQQRLDDVEQLVLRAPHMKR